jgi:hypothetical protein
MERYPWTRLAENNRKYKGTNAWEHLSEEMLMG